MRERENVTRKKIELGKTIIKGRKGKEKKSVREKERRI